MKKLETKVAKLEAKAKRLLLKKEAKRLERAAAKFRKDALKIGADLEVSGTRVYQAVHPVYQDMILPLLEEAARIANLYGFNALYQTHTPMPGVEQFTSVLGSIDSRNVTPTMKSCVDLIQKRPVIARTRGGLITETQEEPPAKSDNAE